MSNTWAVPLEVLAKRDASGGIGRPICPACMRGYLHPYLVEIALDDAIGGWRGANYLQGWVGRCAGDREENDHLRSLYVDAGQEVPPMVDHPACGFVLPMTAKRYYGRGPGVAAEPVDLLSGAADGPPDQAG